MDTNNIIVEPSPLAINVIIQILKSIILLKSHIHQHSLKRSIAKTTPHKFIILLSASKKAILSLGINDNI